jgi:GT2 family glycosyltransferase
MSQALLRPAAGVRDRSSRGGRPAATGKFFTRDGRKLQLRGVTYGPFSPGTGGEPVPERSVVDADVHRMAAAGVNCVRTFTTPPPWFLDLAGDAGLGVLVTVPWPQHVRFLDDMASAAAARLAVRTAAQSLGAHPALFGLLVGNEIPPDVVRWHGPERVRAFLAALVDEARQHAPDTLVSYATFPPTEYLDVAELVDFLAVNVYLHDEAAFRRYLGRLHSLAERKPLVLTELGVDSASHGLEGQARMLDWMLPAAFDCGVAGTFVFAWTDDWHTGGAQIDAWPFGLVDAGRQPKPALASVARVYQAALPLPLEAPPAVSVIVCVRNGAATIDACLEGCRTLAYPNLEIVVVDDGSTDDTAARIDAARQRWGSEPDAPALVIVRQPPRGLGAARNAGAAAAGGEVLAYTDADCMPDADWLRYLVGTLVRAGVAAVGGPNLPPAPPARVPAAVGSAPGGPTHVLLDDETAEHVPGCNMAVRRAVLDEVGGFDPQFHTAGDDVDLCWRLQDRGHRIAFSPAALVWHHSRHTAGAYLRQQMGYGRAEAALFFRHPDRFNVLGQSVWRGRVYGGLTGTLLSTRPIIYYGTFGRAPFQTLYESPGSLLWYLPFTPEWTAAVLVIGLASLAVPRILPLALVGLCITAGSALVSAWRAVLPPPWDDVRSRLVLAVLTWLGPLVRGFQRHRWRWRRLDAAEPPSALLPGRAPWRLGFVGCYWSERGVEKGTVLAGVLRHLEPRGYVSTVDSGWRAVDLEVRRGLWSRAEVLGATEDHGGARRLVAVRVRARPTPLAWMAAAVFGVVAAAAMLASQHEVAAMGGVLAGAQLALMAWENARLVDVIEHAVDVASAELGLVAVGAEDRARS